MGEEMTYDTSRAMTRVSIVSRHSVVVSVRRVAVDVRYHIGEQAGSTTAVAVATSLT